MNHLRRSLSVLCTFAALAAIPTRLHAEEITRAQLTISGGAGLQVVTPVTVQVGSIAQVQTTYSGPVDSGVLAVGELVGPGITTPIRLTASPGQPFQVAGITQKGTYYLQNIRMEKAGQLLEMAVPSVATIEATNALQTKVTVRQLTPDELRERGISVDPSNYDVYEYTFSYTIKDGVVVQVPYPVIVNRITHEVTPVQTESPYKLPRDTAQAPPRWNPPAQVPFEFGGGFAPMPGPGQGDHGPAGPPPPQIHAALVIPNSLAVLHQFFDVGLVVANGAPVGSKVVLQSVSASLKAPSQIRVADSKPAASYGQPVAIPDLNESEQGSVEWTAEGLKPGTYQLDLDVLATFHVDGQKDIPLVAHPKAAIVVHDARFNITFSHPDTVNKNVPYNTYTFITNTSDAVQHVILNDGGIPECGAGTRLNVCRATGSPASFTVDLDPGQTKSVQWKLVAGINGHVLATAASIDGEGSSNLSAAFQLEMGVSPNGVPLSPATLLLPYYARPPYFSQNYLDQQLGFFGIGYGLATAPLNKQTAKFPRVITTDVFTRAVDLARAGERMFIGEDRRDSLANLTLDLLGNSKPLQEWDQFRRQEIEGDEVVRNASKAMGDELAAAFAGTDGGFSDLVPRFAKATSSRNPYVLAFAHGAATGSARSYPIRITAASGVMDVPSSTTCECKRQIPWGDEYALNGSSESGELAVIGRDGEYDLTLTPTASGMLDLVFFNSGTAMRASAPLTAGNTIRIHIANGLATSNDIALPPITVGNEPIRIIAARQDLHLDPDGHVVSVLFNRPLAVTNNDLSKSFSTTVKLDSQKFNEPFDGTRVVKGAALQEDARIIRLNYDSSLSSDALYNIHTQDLVDPASNPDVVPIVESRNSALILGSVIGGDNKPVKDADLILNTVTGVQYQTSDASGRFLFEYVPREVEGGLSGGYMLSAYVGGKQATVPGTVRLLHSIQHVNVSFLGRGSARGRVAYDNGTAVGGATVVAGSTMLNQVRYGTTDASGYFEIGDVPVGPLTFSAQDAAGNVAYAANELHASGEVVVQDILIYQRPHPGTGTVRGRIVRSDGDHAPVPGAHVGVCTQGFSLRDSYTDSLGRFEFTNVPSGFVTVLAEDYDVAPQSVAVDFDLKSDATYDTGDLILTVRDAEAIVGVEGVVTIEDPLRPGVESTVKGAVVQIEGMPAVIADDAGRFVYTGVPQSFGGKRIRAYDPLTARAEIIELPSLSASVVNIKITIKQASGSGAGTVRVHLLNARGGPVSGYRVFEPGYPTLDAEAVGDGVYEFKNVAVGRTLSIVATPSGASDATYGVQIAQGSGGVAFAGQIAAVTLRLPGQGTVRGRIVQQTSGGGTIRLVGKLRLWFLQWDDREQNLAPAFIDVPAASDADAIFTDIPANQLLRIETVDAQGYASADLRLFFEGDSQSRELTLTTLASITGRVIGIDGYTPVSGAIVTVNRTNTQTGADGTYRLQGLAPATAYTILADFNQNGIYRTSYADVSTPPNGGPVNNVDLLLMKQGAIEGKIVNASGAPIAFAKYWLRELSFPGRPFGSQSEPLTTDGNGHFRVDNVFTVPVRLWAIDPNNPDLSGTWNGALVNEGDVLTPVVTVGGAGTGTVTVSVVDPNNGYAGVANAEVSLYRSSLFDLQTTDSSGTATFHDVPVGSYTVGAYSKAQVKFGSSDPIDVVRDGTSTVQVKLAYSGEVDGTLVDPEKNGAAVLGANVTLYGSGYQTRTTTTDKGFYFKGVREGRIALDARDPLSIRRAYLDNVLVSVAAGTTHVPLVLERTSTLTVRAFLPNDDGSSSSVAAPLVSIDVEQSAPGGHYLRTSQTNGAQFPGLIRGVPVSVTVHELGGRNRTASTSVALAEPEKETDLTFIAFGSVTVHVTQGGAVAPNVYVSASSGGVSSNGYTDAAGNIRFDNLPFGTVSIQASTGGSHPLTASGSVAIVSQSIPASASIELGTYGAIKGYVDAEGGGPSVGTRVIASYANGTLETRTDAFGFFEFQGIIASVQGTPVNLLYLGPDDATAGASQVVTIYGSETKSADRVTLDSTPARLLSIFPADGATKVAPNTKLTIAFSRAMKSEQLSGGYVALYDVATGASLSLLAEEPALQADKSVLVTFKVNVTPPPGQRYALKSDTLYRIQVSSDLQDLGNHKLGVTVGASFTTSNYANPQVTKVVPTPKLPLPKNGLRFAITFSKPIKSEPWAPGGNGVMQLVQVDRNGNAIGGPVPGVVQLDTATNTLYFAPNNILNPISFYRLSISGVTDADGQGLIDAAGNPLSVWTQDFSSYDEVAPVVAINDPLLLSSAIAPGDPLYSGVVYTIPVTLTNPDGSPATDVEDVDFYSVDAAGAATPLSHTGIKSVDVTPVPGSTSFTLKVVAHDFSKNYSTPVTRAWQVQPVPPLAIASTAIAPAAVYPGKPFTNNVTLGGGAITANVTVAIYVNGDTIPAATQTQAITRSGFSASWPVTAFTLQLPVTTPANATVVVKTTASDARGAAAPRTDNLSLLADTIAPRLNPLTIELVRGNNASSLHNADQYRVHAIATDAETGIKSVTFTIGSASYVVSSSANNEFVSPLITVQSHNEDFTVSLSAEAADYGQNKASAGTTVTYLGIHDANAPVVAWLSPIHDAAWPASLSGFKTRLSVYATSKLPLTAKFDVPGLGTVNGVRNDKQFDADITLNTPAEGTLTITAHVDDGDGGHVFDLPVTIDLVTYTQILSTGTTPVDATHGLTGDSIIVDGARLVPHIPLTLKNLIVINGGVVDTVNSTTNRDESITINVSDHLFVDGRSRIDVSSRGYLGGKQANFDGTGQNDDPRGMTVNRAFGAAGAAGSHAGIGGEEPGGTSNATYGSLIAPSDLGSGGAADASNRRGGEGGGAVVATSAGKIVIAGSVMADGESGAGIGFAGAAGSIHLSAKTVALGAMSSITANGGDDDGADLGQRGGGGGRISIEGSSLLDIDTTLGARVAARGGRNLASETATAIDGGAGTIFLRYPGETNGELLIDSGFSTSAHRVRGTVIAESRTFDRVTVGPRALARFDGTTNDRASMNIDPTARVALTTDLPSITASAIPSGSLIQYTNLSVTYNASSYTGVGRVVVSLDPQLAGRIDEQSTTATDTLLVPANAAPNSSATLHVKMIDLAGRVAEAPAQSYTIVANAAPVINTFDVSAPSPLYVGGAFSVAVAATDDVGVNSVSLTTQIGNGAPSTQTSNTASKTFSVAVPSDKTLDGQTITLTASATDGYPNRTTTLVKTLPIAHDGVAPSVAIAQPAAGTLFNEGTNNLIPITVTVTDAESGVASVTASIEGGETITLTGSGTTYTGSIHVPSVPDGNDVARVIRVNALDVVGNNRTSEVSVTIHPLYDPTAPVTAWTCGTDGAVYPPGFVATLKAEVTPSATGNAIDTVTFSDGTTTLVATKSGTTYSAQYAVPDTPGQRTIVLTARSIGGGTATLVGQLYVVLADKTISADTTITSGDTTYEGRSVAITAGTTSINGSHQFKTLMVLGAARVTHAAIVDPSSDRLDLKADMIYVSCGAAIDVTARGFAPKTSYAGARPAAANAGGSHIGRGGLRADSGTTYGSVYRPSEAGAGDFFVARGGGAVKLEAGSVTIDGSISANGESNPNASQGGAAGGAVWIKGGTVRGAGTVAANGGDGAAYSSSDGGGGAIAIETGDSFVGLNRLSAKSGAWYNPHGGAGTIFTKYSKSNYGDALIDNSGIPFEAPTVLPSLGVAFIDSVLSPNTLTLRDPASIPTYFAGHWLRIEASDGTVRGFKQIRAVTSPRQIVLDDAAGDHFEIQAGDTIRGTYRFDRLTLRGAWVETADLLVVETSPVLESGSILKSGNLGAPVFTPELRSQIWVKPTASGAFEITGPVGAVSDPDLPVKLTATGNHGAIVSGQANADGSFNVPVYGSNGETFTLTATDSHSSPATSLPVAVNGQIVLNDPVVEIHAQPAVVAPGDQLTVAVRLQAAAPMGGINVSLSSSNGALAVPSTLFVPGGATVGSLTLTAGTVTSATDAVVTAVTNGTPQSMTISIVPAPTALTSVSVGQASITGGSSTTGTVTLGGIAPPGGATVMLVVSDSSLISIPSAVTIAPGATTATFTVTALKTGIATITAIYGATRTTSLEVTSCGLMPAAVKPGTTADVVWLDDTLPAGVTLSGGNSSTSQTASGTTSISLSGTGRQQFTLSGATTWNVINGDSLVLYALIDPCKPPREIQVIWKDTANTEYRASWGEDVIDPTMAHLQVGPMIVGGAWLRLQALASTLGAAGKSITSITVQTYDGEAWFDLFGKSTCSLPSVPSSDLNAADFVWFEDDAPAGVSVVSVAPNGAASSIWNWDSLQKLSGSKSHLVAPIVGSMGEYFTGTTTPLQVKQGDMLVTYVLIDPCNPPRQIFLQWFDGTDWSHRAYWGEDLTAAGTIGTASRYRMGSLPASGRWIRLEVPASLVGLDGVNVSGMSFSLVDGRAWFDHVGKVSRVNLALGKNASQSSNYTGYSNCLAGIGVDGVTNGTGDAQTITHTNNELHAWWQVDLGSVQPIEDIQIWGRADGYYERIVDYWVFVSDVPFTSTDLAATRGQSGVSAYHSPTQLGRMRDIRVARTGRYVRFQLEGANWLSLSEVQVWAPASSMAVNLAGGRTATQWPATFKDPSLTVPYYAEFAVNGDANGLAASGGSFTHTTADTNPHWDVDLGAIRSISSVDVDRRLDCASICPNQIQDFYLFVSDVPFASNLVADTIAQTGVGIWYHGLQVLPATSIPVYRTGRYVRVARSLPSDRPDVVSLNEVRVWGGDTPLAPLATTPPPAEQSSTSIIRLH